MCACACRAFRRSDERIIMRITVSDSRWLTPSGKFKMEMFGTKVDLERGVRIYVTDATDPCEKIHQNLDKRVSSYPPRLP